MLKNEKLTTPLAFAPIIMMALLVFVGNMTMGIDLKFLLLVATIFSGFIASYVGISLDEMLEAYAEKVKKAFPAILILIAIGGIVGTWMFSGTVPMMIYYGLKLLNPNFVIVTAFIVTALVSTFTGTSWGSAATSGVAFMGIAQSMGLSLPMTAGAVLSGAVFGDKVSPVSDTTNLSAMSAEITVYEHIKGMLPNVVIAGSASIAGFLFLGFVGGGSGEISAEALKIMRDLEAIYNFNIFMLIPAVIVFAGGYKGYNPLLLMLTASIAAIIIGVVSNGFSLVDGAAAMISGFNLDMIPVSIEDLSPRIAALLSRGGFEGMVSGAVLFCFLAMPFGSFMEVSGCLDVIMKKMLKVVTGKYSLSVVTFFAGAILNGVTGNGQFSIMTIGQMFKESFREKGIPMSVLSRSMENSMTLLESLLPWHVTAIYMAATLGVPTVSYIPWAFFNLLGVALFFILTGIQFRSEKAEVTDVEKV